MCRSLCLTWLSESSVAKQDCKDAKYLWDPDLNKEHEELKAFVNKDPVMAFDGGKPKARPSLRCWDVGQFCMTKLRAGTKC